ncbi:MAG: anaerobic ribonucleoside-triphosphate reductase activating protein [Thermodesulfobacteriota bacterium]|nr:anaerobic ribonucleoside-triphosphate reductase activating protein [Thermodesulfobacteriota bacterium]
MRIGSIQRSSLIDYPGKISAIVFTIGCNFRCPYCHNPELVDPGLFPDPVPEEEVIRFLERRKGKLDAVVITGGEPALQDDLLDFMARIKKMGYLVKLDSNGSRPEIIEEAISRGVVDYLAMDVKAPLDKYQDVTKSNINTDSIISSIDKIMGSSLDYEFRTTILRPLLTCDDILEIGHLIKGARTYVLQMFVPTKTLDPKLPSGEAFSDDEIRVLKDKLSNRFVDRCIVR